MKEKIIIVGGGGHAKVLISVIKKSNKYEISGYVDFNDYGDIMGIKYLGNDNLLNELKYKGIKYAALGIGQINITDKRLKVIEKLKNMGFYFPVIKSPDAVVNESVQLGEGVQIFDGVIINSGTTIGENTIINTNVTIEHDCSIGKYCHIATGVNCCGGVEIGDNCMIGAGSTIIQYKSIAANTLLGAGSLVTKDIIISGKYFGVPTRKINE